MKLTQEQIQIINSTGDIKINAVAGSGKTTTVIEYARTRPAKSKILYVAFNKSVKLEAIKKFAEKGIKNVNVETAHSLAYKAIVFKHGYKVNNLGYKTNEVVEHLNVQGNSEKHTEYVVANHINKFIAYFCNSDKQKVQDLNYLDTITDTKARTFVTSFYRIILDQARIFLGMMDTGEIEITHDFYLKKFQLSNPVLNYDYILFDEGQDASPAMLDVFLKQKATKVIVGDTHQQIYGWRFALNALAAVNFKTYYLSTSFRFSQDIANLAMDILKLKEIIGSHKTIPIIGKRSSNAIKTKAVLARTNLGLLLKAIEYVTEKKDLKKIYFEGNINSYTYADDGASLYDVLNLYNYKHHLIKDKLIKAMKDIAELEDYINKTEDVQLGLMVEIVKKYGNDIPQIIKDIKSKHVDNDEKEKAEMIFSTVHRSKGMEYDTVQLVNDFITKEKLEKQTEDKEALAKNFNKLNEEINLLYVAATRTKNNLYIPETLMPENFPSSTFIRILKVKEPEAEKPLEIKMRVVRNWQKEKAYDIEKIRTVNKDAYRPWSVELDMELTTMYCKEVSIKDMAKHFGRTFGAIDKRIKKLELRDIYDK